jgi:hypothetical protein
MMQVFYLDVAYVYNGFKCFSGVFAGVSDACFICFQIYVAIVASGCFKLECCIYHLAFLLSCLGVRRGKVEAVPTGMGGPHVLAGRCSKLDVDGQARDEGRGQRRERPDRGLPSGRLRASHSH